MGWLASLLVCCVVLSSVDESGHDHRDRRARQSCVAKINTRGVYLLTISVVASPKHVPVATAEYPFSVKSLS